VTGRPPFTGDDPNAIIYQHVNNAPESPTTHNEAIALDLEQLIMKLLAKEKADRPGSADEVLAELEQVATQLATGQPRALADVREAPASPIEQEIRFCTSADGTRIAYATYGDPAARPLVLVNMFDLAQELFWKDSGRRALYEGLASSRMLVTCDRRGVGSSQREVEDLAIPSQVADVAAVVDQLGLESFDLMGWSNGAALAAAYAAEYPQRVVRLVLWHPLIRISGPRLEGMQALVQSIRANWSLARRSWATIAYPNGPTDLQRWFSSALRDSLAPEMAARHLDVIAEFDGNAVLRSVKAPTLVLANLGRQDLDIDSVRTVASLILDGRLVTLEGDSGTLGVDSSDLLAAIERFLDEAHAGSEATD
jgi:pimeloyl-ACP methyl ester carboxylesterase